MEKISRRKFLAVPLAAGAAIALQNNVFGQKAVRLMPPISSMDALSRLNWDAFYPFQTTDFIFTGDRRQEIALTLVEMKNNLGPLASKRQRFKTQESFMLKFRGPSKMPLTQGTYEVEHFRLGNFALFITQGAVVGSEAYYFAVINRIIA